MLDIGFSELMVIGAIALIVLGPEKLAIVAHITGKWVGKAQRYLNNAKHDLANEVELSELRQLKADLQSAGRQFQQSAQTDIKAIQAMTTLDYHNIDEVKAFEAQQYNASQHYTNDNNPYQAALNDIQAIQGISHITDYNEQIAQLKTELSQLEHRIANLNNDLNHLNHLNHLNQSK